MGQQLEGEAAAYVLEDSRLSTLQRKLAREGDEAVALSLAVHINDVLLYPENATYISRSAEVLQEGVLEVLGAKETSAGVRGLCGVALGRVGALHTNHREWVGWVWAQVEKAGERERVAVVYLSALTESLARGGGSREGVTRLLDSAKAALEQTQSEVLMLALLGVVEAAARHWGVLFKAIFTEVVDIAVGWFMESAAMPDVRVRIAEDLMAWGVFWQGEPEFAADQVGFYLEDLVLEVVGEEGSRAVAAIAFKWQAEAVEEEERVRAHRQLVAFLQMVEAVLVGVGGSGALALARLDGLALPKLGLWLEVVAAAGRAALAYRWTEDLAITLVRCLQAGLRVLQGLAMPREREELVVAAAMEVVGRSGSLSTEGLRVVCCSLASLQGASPASQQVMAEGVLGEGGLLPRAALGTTSPALLAAATNLVQTMLQSRSVAVLTEVRQGKFDGIFRPHGERLFWLDSS